jgi:hypothetical protein
LDIVVWAVRADTAEESSNRAQKVFDACAARGLHLALVQLPEKWFAGAGSAKDETDTMTCLRSVLMKPEHGAWMGEIWERLSAATGDVAGQ